MGLIVKVKLKETWKGCMNLFYTCNLFFLYLFMSFLWHKRNWTSYILQFCFIFVLLNFINSQTYTNQPNQTRAPFPLSSFPQVAAVSLLPSVSPPLASQKPVCSFQWPCALCPIFAVSGEVGGCLPLNQWMMVRRWQGFGGERGCV